MAHERTYAGHRAYFPDLPRETGDRDRLGRWLSDGDTVEFDDPPPSDDTRFVTRHRTAKKTAAKPESEES